MLAFVVRAQPYLVCCKIKVLKVYKNRLGDIKSLFRATLLYIKIDYLDYF